MADAGVFYGIMQKRGADGLNIQSKPGHDHGHREGVGYVGVTIIALLPIMSSAGDLKRTADHIHIRMRRVAEHAADQFFTVQTSVGGGGVVIHSGGHGGHLRAAALFRQRA